MARDQAKKARSDRSDRVRITFEVDKARGEEVKAAAATAGLTISEFTRRILFQHLDREIQAEMELALGPPAGPESDEARKARFLEAVETKFSIAAATKLAALDRAQVRSWMSSPDFVDLVRQAQEAFIEQVEASLLDVGRGRIKGQFMALVIFLNAHHPHYGRVRIETLARILGPTMERFYKIVREECGQQAEKVIERLRQVADQRLSEFSE